MPFRTLRGWGRRPCRVYSFDACIERWGEPDPDRLCLLLRIVLPVHARANDAACWELFTPRPLVVDEHGDLAVTMEER